MTANDEDNWMGKLRRHWFYLVVVVAASSSAVTWAVLDNVLLPFKDGKIESLKETNQALVTESEERDILIGNLNQHVERLNAKIATLENQKRQLEQRLIAPDDSLDLTIEDADFLIGESFTILNEQVLLNPHLAIVEPGADSTALVWFVIQVEGGALMGLNRTGLREGEAISFGYKDDEYILYLWEITINSTESRDIASDEYHYFSRFVEEFKRIGRASIQEVVTDGDVWLSIVKKAR